MLKIKHEAVLAASITLIVLIIERFVVGKMIFSLVVDADLTSGWLSQFLLNNGKAISRTITLSIAIFCVLRFRHFRRIGQEFVIHTDRRQYLWLAFHLVAFFTFYQLTPTLLEANRPLHSTLWGALGLLVTISALLALAGYGFWRSVLRNHGRQLALAVMISSFVWWFGSATQSLWASMNQGTFMLVQQGLEFLHGDVYIHLTDEQKIIGVENFLVNIAPACSGYEGIGLITAFTAIYLYSFRDTFRFPIAFVLFPLAAIIIWLFNALRIIALINIGAFWSPDVAVWGFHSQAGWMTFIIASILLMLIAHRTPIFVKAVKSNDAPSRLTLPIATLIPVIALLTATLITQTLSAQFDWLYPARVLITATAIGICWKSLNLSPITLTYWAAVGGVLVAALWILIVPNSPETDQVFVETIHNAPASAVVFWLIFRFVGSAITVPIAEELGFRAYLLCRFSSQEVVTRGKISFSVVGFLVSSLAFGFLHGAWIAGTLAGMIYAAVRYKSNHVADAIVAHGITNALLFVYVYYTGFWSML